MINFKINLRFAIGIENDQFREFICSAPSSIDIDLLNGRQGWVPRARRGVSGRKRGAEEVPRPMCGPRHFHPRPR